MDLDQTTFVLSPEAWDRFMAILDNPPPPTPALRKAMAFYRNVETARKDRDESLPFTDGGGI